MFWFESEPYRRQGDGIETTERDSECRRTGPYDSDVGRARETREARTRRSRCSGTCELGRTVLRFLILVEDSKY